MGTSSCFELDENIDAQVQKEKPNKTEEERKTDIKVISENSSEKLYNSIVRVNAGLNEKELISGTGFFIKLNLSNETRNYLITCNDIINEKFIADKKAIKIYYRKITEEKNIEIKLDRSKRDIKTYKNSLNLTLIEIIKEDKISEDKFLLPDMNYKQGGYSFYTNKDNYYYLSGYTRNNERVISSGQITQISKNQEFKLSLDDAVYIIQEHLFVYQIIY